VNLRCKYELSVPTIW